MNWQLSIFEDGRGASFSLQKNFRDKKTGEWRRSGISFFRRDAMSIMDLLEHLVSTEPDLFKSTRTDVIEDDLSTNRKDGKV